MKSVYEQELVFRTRSLGYRSGTRGNVQRMGRTIRGLDAEQRRAERREQLLDAALKLFAANGYINTSIEQICSTAYIGTKSFYEVFTNREDCYVALLQRTSERLQDQVAGMASQAVGNEREVAPKLIQVFAHALLDDPRVAKVTFGMAAGISPLVERQRRTNRRWAAGFLEQLWDRYDGPPSASSEKPPPCVYSSIDTYPSRFASSRVNRRALPGHSLRPTRLSLFMS